MEAYQWGPGTEKLLESLRQYSSELLESLNRSADSIERLSRASMQARIAVDNIKNRFELLSLNHSVTQVCMGDAPRVITQSCVPPWSVPCYLFILDP